MIKAIHPLNLGWLQKELSDQEMDYLWRCIKNRKGDHRSKLAGNISGSYLLIDRGDWFWLNTLKPLCEKYKEEFYNLGDHLPINSKHLYYMNQWWVNYQKETEFNPSHDHSGVYSFVIWMKIPTHYKDQKRIPIASHSGSKCISNFEFSYLDICGNNHGWQYPMSPEWEGNMVFFPGKLKHQVYPFYNCDEERISISGNILLKPS